MSLRSSIKDSHLFLNRHKTEENLTHPSFSISMKEPNIVTTVSLNKEHPVYLKGFFILHRESGKHYEFPATEIDHTTFSFQFNLTEFIHQLVPQGGREHFEFYMQISYFIENQWIDKSDPISLDLFEHFDSFGLTQFKDREDNIYPYFSRKTNGFCFTVNVPVRSLRYIQGSQITSLKTQHQKIKIEGTIVSKAIAINRIDTIMVGKKSGIKRRIHSTVMLEHMENGTHLYHYEYHILVDIKEIARELLLIDFSDDEFDIYFEIYLNGLFQPTVVRVGNPKKLTRKWLYKNAYYTYAKTSYTFAPNFTAQDQSLSIYVTRFEKEVFAYFREMLFLFWLIRPFYLKRNIWVIGEKPDTANNNGFAFYQYMRQTHPKHKVYYVLDENAPDYQKVAAYGEDHILPFNSKKYIWHLFMERVLLTAYPAYEIYPTRTQQLTKLIRGKKVYLQNEVLGLEDEAILLDHSSLPIETDLFLVSSKNEKRLVVNNLGYSEKQVVITGMASFDWLLDSSKTVTEKELILFFPVNHETGLHFQTELSDILARSYLSLLNSQKFQSYLTEHQLGLIVALPEAFQDYATEFQHVATTMYHQSTMDTVEVLKMSKLMITDYAAEAFEFSFLDKPVFFYQVETRFHHGIDKQAYARQAYQNELPGEIATNEAALLHLLEACRAADFKLSKKNKQKATLLLEYQDTNARERIFETVESFLKGNRPTVTKADQALATQLTSEKELTS